MKVTDRDPHFFDDWRTEADDDVTLAGFVGAVLALGLCLVALFGWLVIGAAGR